MRFPRLRGKATAIGITLALGLTVTSLAGCTGQASQPSTAGRTSQTSTAARAAAATSGIGKIRHVVIIMQENRSFDSYFGTYPGADGIPGLAGNPGTVPCVPNPVSTMRNP